MFNLINHIESPMPQEAQRGHFSDFAAKLEMHLIEGPDCGPSTNGGK